MTIVKNPSQWINPGGQGFVLLVGNLLMVDNSDQIIVDNTSDHHQLAITPLQSIPKYPSEWTLSGA